MPSGPKRKSTVLINKQKRLIASRLMQISLVLDDYLYKQKSISQRSAEAYIREISSYIEKCSGDVRSLQVIEKLTRCMKGIIEEQQELQRDDKTDNVIRFQEFTENHQMSLSPVYSTVDEDLTQALEDVGKNEVIEEVQGTADMNKIGTEKCNNGNEVLNLDDDLTQVLDIEYNENLRNDLNIYTDEFNDIIKMIDADEEVMRNYDDKIDDIAKNNNADNYNPENNVQKAISTDLGQNTLVIDISDDEIDSMNNKFTNRPAESEFNIETGISSLSIIDIDESPSTTPLFQESQSILKNCYDNQQIYLDIPLTQDNGALKPAVTRKPEKKMTAIRDTAKNVSHNNLRVNPQKFSDNPEIFQVQNERKDSVNEKKLKPRNKKTANGKDKIKPKDKKGANTKNKNNPTELSRITSKAKNNSNTRKVTNKKLKDIQKYAKETISMQQTQHKYSKATSENCMQEITQTSYNTSNFPIIQRQAQITNETYQRTQTKFPDIYSTNVVDDLSWIENIRYVREVCREEYEACTFDESFWENCTLPSNWSEEDFN